MDENLIIFLAELNQDFLDLRSKLENSGFGCLFFENPADVLSQAEWLPPDVFVIDADLLNTTLPPFLQELLHCVDGTLPTTIILSSTISEAAFTEALEFGVTDFLAKPISFSLLKAKLSRIPKTTPSPRATRSVPKTSLTPKFIGRYQILQELGRGGMGVVYKALHPAGAPVALKTLVADANSLDAILRFRREIDLLISISHPNLIRMRDTGRAKSVFYYTMDFIDGDSLEEVIHDTGPATFDSVVRVCIALADALQHIHDLDLIHRDIKPGNILICPNRGPILSDFGLSKSKLDSQLTATNQLVGTPHFMAPEYILGHDQTNRSDLFALGMVALEMLLGRPLFNTNNSYTIMQAIVNGEFPRCGEIEQILNTKYPARFRRIIDKLVSLDPLERYSSALALKVHLLHLSKIEARPTTFRH